METPLPKPMTKAQLEEKMGDYYQFREPFESAKRPKLITDETMSTVDVMREQRELYASNPELIKQETAEVQAEVDRIQSESEARDAITGRKKAVFNPRTGEWENQFGEIAAIACVIMAGTGIWSAMESDKAQKNATELQKKADAQAAIDREKALKDQQNYMYLTYAGLGISVISLIVFVYMVLRKG